MNERKKSKKTKWDGLFVPARQVSMLAAGTLVIGALVFLGGYFVGKKHMIDQFIAQVEHDSFADHVYASLCAMYDIDPLLKGESVHDGEQETETTAVQEAESGLLVSDRASERYVGQLLSYHIRKYADDFVKKMNKKNVPLEVRTRKSVTTNGKEKEWYQVVTKPYADREKLMLLVEQLSREEKIKGAQIIVC